MGSIRTFALAGIVAAAMAAPAAAADLLPPPPIEPLPPPVEIGGGWYLRGDVGVSIYDGAKFSSPDLPPAEFYGEDFNHGALFGIGLGYQFGAWFRADVTGEYRFSTGVKAYDRIRWNAGGVPGITRNTYEGDYAAFVGLVNAYFDLGTWHGITPFVGVGVGFANNRLYGFTDTGLTEFPLGGAVTPSGGDIQDGTETNFAWALHAGLAYAVSPNFKVELAYRYLNLGDAKTGIINCFCGQVFSPLKVKDLEAHDFKIGMRWLLAAPAPAPVPVGVPIIRKY